MFATIPQFKSDIFKKDIQEQIKFNNLVSD